MSWILLLFVSVGGCARNDLNVVPATGLVTFAGSPVAGAQVTFMAPNSARAAYAVTDESGRFALSTFGDRDGATPGTHVVTITRPLEPEAAPAMSGEQDDAAYSAAMAKASRTVAPRSSLPTRYADSATSGLTAEVTTAGPNDFVFELEP